MSSAHSADDLRQRDDRLHQAQLTKDFAALEELLHEAYTFTVPYDGSVVTRAQFFEDLRTWWSPTSIEAGAAQVQLVGQTGLVRRRLTIDWQQQGQPMRAIEDVTNVYSFDQGRWRCIAAHSSDAGALYNHRLGHEADRQAVSQAVLDYVEGLYEADPVRLGRSLHPHLAKSGYFVAAGQTAGGFAPMSAAELRHVAEERQARGEREAADAPRRIIVYDVQDKTASAKLIASWGSDYMHLGKYGDTWLITNVLWQIPPQPAS